MAIKNKAGAIFQWNVFYFEEYCDYAWVFTDADILMMVTWLTSITLMVMHTSLSLFDLFFMMPALASREN